MNRTAGRWLVLAALFAALLALPPAAALGQAGDRTVSESKPNTETDTTEAAKAEKDAKAKAKAEAEAKAEADAKAKAEKEDEEKANGGGGLFGGQWMMFVMIGGIVLLFFWMSRKPKKEEQRRQAMLSNLKKGDKITTIGGIVGTVMDVREEEVTLKVDESSNTRLRFAKWAVRMPKPVPGAPGPQDVQSQPQQKTEGS